MIQCAANRAIAMPNGVHSVELRDEAFASLMRFHIAMRAAHEVLMVMPSTHGIAA
jgi:hypothetical protein